MKIGDKDIEVSNSPWKMEVGDFTEKHHVSFSGDFVKDVPKIKK